MAHIFIASILCYRVRMRTKSKLASISVRTGGARRESYLHMTTQRPRLNTVTALLGENPLQYDYRGLTHARARAK